MRLFILFTILLILTKIASSQTSYFNKTYQLNGTHEARAIIETDSYYYVYGIALDTPYVTNQKIFLHKLDKSGNLLHETLWWDTLHLWGTYPRAFVESDSNSFIACGAIVDSLQTVGYIMKIDRNQLDTLWTRRFPDPDSISPGQNDSILFNILTSIQQTSDNGYICVGKFRSYLGKTNILLLKTDSLGQKEWMKLIGYPGVREVSYDIEIAPDSGYLIAGSYKTAPAPTLIKTDINGNIEWFTKFGGPLPQVVANDVEITNDSCAIFGQMNTYEDNGSTAYTNILVAKVELDSGNILWEKEYFFNKYFQQYGLHQAMGVDVLDDGCIIISGSTYRPDSANPTIDGGHFGGLMKLSPNGDSLWSRTIQHIAGIDDDHSLWDLAPTSDGGFIFVGDYVSAPYTRLHSWVVKLDSVGCEYPGCNVSLANYLPTKVHLKLYPNPARIYFNIEYQTEKKYNKLWLEIHDITGRSLKKQELKSGNNAELIDVKDLINGIYMVSLYGDGEIIASERINIVK